MLPRNVWHIEHIPSSKPLEQIVSRWHLDAPASGSHWDGKDQVTLSGWALAADYPLHQLHFVVRTLDGTWSYPVRDDRPDVVRALFNREPSNSCELSCGFSRSLAAQIFETRVQLGFELGGIICPAATIQLVAATEIQALQDQEPKNEAEDIGYIDSPVDGQIIGHDYITVSGWCYLQGEKLRLVTAEIVGSGKTSILRFGLPRHDIKRVHANFSSYDVGFSGHIYPYIEGLHAPELAVTAVTETSRVFRLRTSLMTDFALTGPPQSRHMTSSELGQQLNNTQLFH